MLGELEKVEARGVRDQFALLVSSVVDYAIFMLDPTGQVITWNVGAQRIKGYDAGEIVGRHFSIFYPIEDARRGKPARALEAAARDGRFETEGWRVRKDGSKFWASVVITALRDETGNLCGFGKVTRDLTERHLRELEQEAVREREAEQLRIHAARMAELERTKTEFLNLASHELRGPLAVARGYNSMLEDGSIGAEKITTVARLIDSKLAQMDLLIEQMLETARLEQGDVPLQTTSFDVAALAASQVEVFRPLAQGHELVADVPSQPVFVDADRSRTHSVIRNLLDNAIKYSPNGGEIRCTVRREGRDVVIEVSDQGIGIAPEHIDRLFTRFGRLPTEDNVTIPGTGLGLFLCREIALRHGGDLSVQSIPGTGSTFTLSLPARA